MSFENRPHLGGQRRTGGPGDPTVYAADEQTELVDLPRWVALARGVLDAEGIRGNVELNVLFVDATEITALNAQFMDIVGPTDVLSFPLDADELVSHSVPDPSRGGPDRSPQDPDDIPMLLGDVVICPAVAARQASTHAGTYDDELALLLVHGILHVLGRDHAEPDERTAMWARERELLEQLHWHGGAPAAFRQDQ